MAKPKAEDKENNQQQTGSDVVEYLILEDFASNRAYFKGDKIKTGDLIEPIIKDLIKQKKIKAVK